MSKPIYYLTPEGSLIEMEFLPKIICAGQRFTGDMVKYRKDKKNWQNTSLRGFNEMAGRNKWVSITEKDIKDFGL